jgi:hypothetical protein
LLSDGRFLFCLYAGAAVVVSIRGAWLRPGSINNFRIFRCAFLHLIRDQNLYADHPAQYDDLFKYSPTFALLMAPLALLPTAVGLLVWNLLNALAPYWAVRALRLPSGATAFVLLFIAIELLGSLQNAQSNGVVTGLMIGSFAAFERRRPRLGTLLVCLGASIKVFPGAAALFLVLHERRTRSLLLCVGWGILLALLPAVVVGVEPLERQYSAWLGMMTNDPVQRLNVSLMTLAQRCFGLAVPGGLCLAAGLAVLLLAVPRGAARGRFDERLRFCASLLIWVVVFNPQSESPTYVIAMCGVALWAVTEPPSALRTLLLWGAFLFTGLSTSDLVPRSVRLHVVVPYSVKALPCVVVWAVAAVQLLAANLRGNQRRIALSGARYAASSGQESPHTS